jgi:hypothetical protein
MKSGLSAHQEKVLNYIRSQTEVEQGDIVRHFYDEFAFKDMNNGRVAISRILSRLTTLDYVKKREEKNEGAGGIYKNVWSLK